MTIHSDCATHLTSRWRSRRLENMLSPSLAAFGGRVHVRPQPGSVRVEIHWSAGDLSTVDLQQQTDIRTAMRARGVRANMRHGRLAIPIFAAGCQGMSRSPWAPACVRSGKAAPGCFAEGTPATSLDDVTRRSHSSVDITVGRAAL